MKSSSKFATAYARLNAEQKKAVDTIDGPVMVIAGPGTGKTEVLTMRIANIIEKAAASAAGGQGHAKVAPEAILALTFTESGVASMRKRLTDLIGTPAYRVTISTFHGFANGIIRNYPDKFPEIIGAVSITDIDQVRIVRDVIDDTPLTDLKPFGDRYYYLKSIMSAINELKRQGVTPAEFTAIVEKEKRAVATIDDLYYTEGAHKGKMKGKYKEDAKHAERNAELALVYTKYQAALRTAKQYDYSDMIMEVMRALETDESLRFMLQEQYKYFLIDEHQDTNDAQNRIIELLAGGGGDSKDGSGNKRPNLFVVGDEKQAIFRFQGASIANFYHFKTLYKDVVLIPLVNNYRSTQAILNAAAAVAPREGGHQLVANAGHPETPAALAVLSSPDAEYFFIAEQAKALIATKKVAPEEIAVLYRENRDAAPLARVLEKLGVPFAIESDQDTLGDEDIQKLLRILRAVQHFGAASYLFDFLYVDFLGIPPLDVYKLFSLAGKKRVNPYDVLRSGVMLDEAGVSTAAKAEFQKQFAQLSDWKRAAENMGAVRAFETIVRDSGFLAAIMAVPSASQKLAKLHTLFELLKSLVENRKNYTLKDFFAYLDLTIEQGVSLKSADIPRIPGRIRLMTAHKSKGQEFDYVFVMNAVDGKWGSRYKHEHIRLPKSIYRTLGEIDEKFDGASQDDSDERNLFYVALTRARKELFVTQSARDREGRELVPTQFAQELQENLLAPLDVTKYETKFAAHRDVEFAPAPAAAPDIEDKTFLHTLFDEQGLSVTALDNYLECPWHYFYVNLIRVPEAPNKHLMYGNAVHDALKHYFDLRSEGDDRGKAYLVEKFEEALAHQPIEESDYEETLARGRKSLPAWFDRYHAEWPIKTQNEVRIAGITLGSGVDAVLINGKLDKIEILDASGKVNVADYKTGKSQTRNAIEGKTKTGTGNYKRQLVFYRLLLDKSEKFSMVSGDVDFIEPDENGKFHKENFAIEPVELEELEKTVLRVAAEIRSLAFWNTTCDDPECRYCGLRKIK